MWMYVEDNNRPYKFAPEIKCDVSEKSFLKIGLHRGNTAEWETGKGE
jgi:hypothetical protein